MAFHRRLRRIGAVGVVVGLVAVGAVLIGSSSPAPGLAPSTQTFTFTGGEQTFAIPPGTAVLHIVAVGGAGAPDAPGPGALVTADVPVPDGVTQLYVEVGGNGADTGTGPGASEVRTCSIADASCGGLVVAGGAGATDSSFVASTALTSNAETSTAAPRSRRRSSSPRARCRPG